MTLRKIPPLKPSQPARGLVFHPDGSTTIDDSAPLPLARDRKQKPKVHTKRRRYCSCGRAVNGNAFGWHVQAGRARGEDHRRVPPPRPGYILDGPDAWDGKPLVEENHPRDTTPPRKKPQTRKA